jgi:hypothetical protein
MPLDLQLFCSGLGLLSLPCIVSLLLLVCGNRLCYGLPFSAINFLISASNSFPPLYRLCVIAFEGCPPVA